MKFIEKPPPEEVERIFTRYGSPRFRRLEWNLNHLEHRRDYGSSRGVVVLLISAVDHLVLVRYPDTPLDHWHLPSGRIRRLEPLEEAGKREALEQTGLSIEVTALPAVHILDVRFKESELELWHFLLLAEVRGGELHPQRETIAEAAFQGDFAAFPNWREDPFQSKWYPLILQDAGIVSGSLWEEPGRPPEKDRSGPAP